MKRITLVIETSDWRQRWTRLLEEGDYNGRVVGITVEDKVDEEPEVSS